METVPHAVCCFHTAKCRYGECFRKKSEIIRPHKPTQLKGAAEGEQIPSIVEQMLSMAGSGYLILCSVGDATSK